MIYYILVELVAVTISLKYINIYAAVFFIIFYLLYVRTKSSSKIVIVVVILVFMLNVLSYNYNSYSELRQYINSEQTVIVKILGKDLIRNSNDESKLYFSTDVFVTGIVDFQATNEGKIEIVHELKEKSIIYFSAVQYDEIIPGNSYKLSVKIKEPKSHKNFMLFNYEEYLIQKNIFVIVSNCGNLEKINESEFSLYKISNDIKIKIMNVIENYMGKDGGDLILSILLGEKVFLDDATYDATIMLGLAHIFAVSGLHVGIILKSVYVLFNQLFCNRRFKIILTLICGWSYGFLVGMPTSIMRSLIMFSFLYTSKFVYRKYNSLNALLISACIIILINPKMMLSTGFMLSYSVTFAIVTYKNIKIEGIMGKILNSMYLYIYMMLLSFPIVVYFFNYVSVIGLVSNLILLPVLSIVIIMSFYVTLLGLIYEPIAIYPMKFIGYILYFIKYILEKIGNFKTCGISLPSFSVEQIVFYYLFLIMIIYFKDRHKKNCRRVNLYSRYDYGKITRHTGIRATNFVIYSYLGIFILNCILIPYFTSYRSFKVYDIGQGIFIELSALGNNYIFDCGSTEEDIYDNVVGNIFKKNGCKDIERIYLSHYHSDHYSAIPNLIDNFDVSGVSLSHEKVVLDDGSNDEKISSESLKKLLEAIFSKGIDVNILKRGSKEKLADKIYLEILYPADGWTTSNENNYSNVYWLSFGGINFLITGDIEAEAEDVVIDDISRMKSKYGDLDVLMVPHHGSKTSSTEKFVNVVSPNIAVFSYGDNNYGIPSEEVIGRYEDIGSIVLKTKIDGQINFFVIGGNLYYNTYNGACSDNWFELIYIVIFLNGWIFLVIYIFRPRRSGF